MDNKKEVTLNELLRILAKLTDNLNQKKDILKDIQQRGATKNDQRARIESLRTRGTR